MVFDQDGADPQSPSGFHIGSDVIQENGLEVHKDQEIGETISMSRCKVTNESIKC